MTLVNTNPWHRLLKLLKLEKKDISALYFYAILSGILSLSLPLGIQSVIRFIQSGQITTSWVVLVALVILGAVLTGVTQIMQLRITENIQQRIFIHYSFDFAFRFPRFDKKAVKEVHTVEMMNRFFDVISLQKGFSKVLLDFTSALLQIVFSLLVLSLYHPFYIAFSILLVLLLIVIFRPMLKRGLATSLKESKHKYATAYWLQQIAKAGWSFRINPTEKLSLNRLDKHAESYLNSREEHFQVLWKQFIWMIAIKALIVGSLLGLGGYLVISQQINLGQFVAAEVLILLLLAAVEKIIQSLETLYDVCTSLEKLEQVRDIPLAFEAEDDGERKSLFPIEIMQIKSEGQKSTPIIQIQEGENLIITGNDPMLVNAMMRQLLDPLYEKGLVTRWNYKVPKWNDIPTGLKKIGYFGHDANLVEGSLFDNVAFGRDGISGDQVLNAINCVDLNHLYQNELDGFDLKLSKEDSFLSRNEAGRLLLARALADSPDFLIASFMDSTIPFDERGILLQRIAAIFPDMTILTASEIAPDLHWKTIIINEF